MDIFGIILFLYIIGSTGAFLGYITIDCDVVVSFRRCWLWPVLLVKHCINDI